MNKGVLKAERAASLFATAAERPVKNINILAFGLGDIFGGGSFFLVSVLTMYYLITLARLSPWLAG